jgi:hypothetical protein
VQCCSSDDLFGEKGSDSLNSIDGVEGNDALDIGSGADTCSTESTANCEQQLRWTQGTGSGLPLRVPASLLVSPELDSAQTFTTLDWEQRGPQALRSVLESPVLRLRFT